MDMVTRDSLIIVIPSRGLEGLLASCLQALQVARAQVSQLIDAQIVVVDNASPIPLDAPGADELVRYDQHRSFSALVNDVATSHPGSHLLLVNNDALVHPDALFSMWEHLSDELVAAVGARLIFPDGTIQHAGVIVDEDGPRHQYRGIHSRNISRLVTRPIAVTGALMLIRRVAFDEVGGFNEGFDFGLEDIDFCHRLRNAGWSIVCDQSVDSLHLESMTPGRVELDVPARARYREIWGKRIPRNARGESR